MCKGTSGQMSVAKTRKRYTLPAMLIAVLVALGPRSSWSQSAPQRTSNEVQIADNNPPLTQLTLEQLGNIEVTTVTKVPEQLWKTPAATYVITQEDIRRAGVTNIPDAL